MREAEERWKEDRAKKVNEETGLPWQDLKRFAGWTTTSSPIKLKNDKGETIYSPKTNAHSMAKFYIEKVKAIRKEQKKPPENSMKMLKKMMLWKQCSFELLEVLVQEVGEAMRKMKNSKSLGPDTVQADLLKMTAT